MNSNIYNYILQALLGGAAGYITNDYAINMLFKEYTPLKLGGIIKKTRNEFIDNISTLVQTDIINREQLNEILTNPAFEKNFNNLVQDFFGQNLYASVENKSIGDIDDIDNSIHGLSEFAQNIIEENLPSLIDLLFNKISADDFITSNQLETLSDNLYSALYDTLDKTDAFENIAENFYSEIKNMYLSEPLENIHNQTNAVTNKMLNNLNYLIQNDLSDSIDILFAQMLKTVEFNNSLTKAKDILFAKKLKEIIVNDNNSLETKTSQYIADYINSEKGQQTIYDIINSIFLYLKSSDKTLFSIIDSTFHIKMKTYLQDNLPHIADSIISWINLNKQNIEGIVENAIDEVISEAEGFKKVLLNTIRTTVLKNVSQKYNIVGSLIDYIEKEGNSENLSIELTNKFIEYFDSTSVSDIINSLESKNIITCNKAVKFVTNYLNDNNKHISANLIHKALELKLSDIVQDNNGSEFIQSAIVSYIKNKIITSPQITAKLADLCNNSIAEKLNKTVEEIVCENNKLNKNNINNTEKPLHYFKTEVLSLIKDNSQKIKDTIINTANKNLLGKTVSDFAGKNISTASYDFISGELCKYYESTRKNLPDVKLHSIVDKINSIDNLYLNSSKLIRAGAIANLDTLLSGSVKGLVSTNLNKLSDDELSDMANEFIGKELKPIMYFGGILGAAAGIALAAIQGTPPQFEAITAANMLTYALVGFGTNAIAINMLFKPYKEIKFLSKIPFLHHFSLGYIAKNQTVFAANMAHFVNNTLISKDGLNELFDKYDKSIQSALVNGISQNDYLLLQNLCINNTDAIVNSTARFAHEYINLNSNYISDFITKSIGKTELKLILTSESIDKASNFISDRIILSNSEHLADNIYNKLNSNSPINIEIPKFIGNNIEKSLGRKIVTYYDLIADKIKNPNCVVSFAKQYNDKYTDKINKPIKDLFGENAVFLFKDICSNKVSEFIISDDLRQNFTNIIKDFVKQQFLSDNSIGNTKANKTVGEIFDGKIKVTINNKLSDYFDKLFEMLKNNIVSYKDVIAQKIKADIKSNLGFLEKSMYSVIGGDDVIDDVLSRIVLFKAPEFIDSKKSEILDVISDTMDERIYNITFDQLKLFSDTINLNKITDNFFNDDKNIEMLKDKSMQIINAIISKTANTNAKNLLELMSLDSLDNITSAYSQELNVFCCDLAANMVKSKTSATSLALNYAHDILNSYASKFSMADCFGDIDFNTASNIASSVDKIIKERNIIKPALHSLLSKYMEFAGESVSIAQVISTDELNKSFDNILISLDNDAEINSYIKTLYSNILIKSAECNFDFISHKSKNYLSDIVVKSAIGSLRQNLDDILKSIEFDKIAQKEIEAMNPQKIHKLFNSFAGKYFRKLMLYGLWGFVFGINIYVGLLLSGIKVVKEISDKRKH